MLVIEPGSVMPGTFEFESGLRGNDIICALGSSKKVGAAVMEAESDDDARRVLRKDLYGRLNTWAKSSRFVFCISYFVYIYIFFRALLCFVFCVLF